MCRKKDDIFVLNSLFLLFFNVLSAQAQQDISYSPTVLPLHDLLEVEKNMITQMEAYPQEKLHLHTDRDFYVPGEKIWFKAYVVDAHSHLHPTYSQYVYVELISPADTLVNRVMLSKTDGMYHGHLPLKIILPEGNYTLRAYTRYMENQGDNYFFKKNIRIGNQASTKNLQQQTAVSNRSNRVSSILRKDQHIVSHTNQIEDDFDVSFFPEGGNLLEGVICKVAFKAINKNGFSEMVTGIITDENENELASTRSYHAGMGFFTYQPVAGKKLYLKCRTENGLEKQFELPQSNPRAYSLAATVLEKKMKVGVQKSVHAPDIPCYLLIHCKGSVLYFAKWDNLQGSITLLEEQLPAGVIQFVLFDEQMNPLSERLIFSKNNETAKVEFQTDKEIYEKREKVIATLKLDSLLSPSLWGRAEEGLSSTGHFSIAVTDDKDIAVDETTTILSSLLLSSELKGFIENPAYYLQDDVAMDLLMMTHGWRRYNVPEVVKGHIEKPQIPFQMFQEITGEVRTLNSRRTVPDSEIHIMMKSEVSKFGVITTGQNGSFIVHELDFSDSTTFYLRALDRNGRDNVKLVVNNESFPVLVYAQQSPTSKTPVTTALTENDTDTNDFMEKAEQRVKFDEDIWTMQMEEVTINAPRVKRDDSRSRFWINADNTITREMIEKYKYPDITYYISMEGVIVVESMGGNLTFYIRQSLGPAVVYIDGFKRDANKYELSVNVVESIEILKSGLGLGMDGANGAISITTRRGGGTGIRIEKFNHTIYSPLGYQKPKKFYAPKYETLEAKRSVIPDYRTTIFWKPDVEISEDGKAAFEFYTSDFKTIYSVVIEGITHDGKMVRQVEKIRVK